MKQKRRMLLLLALLAGCAVLAFFSLRRFEYSQVYYPSRQLAAGPSILGRPCDDVFIPVENGQRVNAWFFPLEPAAQPTRHPVFLVCHGNAGNIADRLDLAQSLLAVGASVLLFDYRGYGRSDGRPSEENTYRDAQAAYRWLRDKGFPPDLIIDYGESLGGGIASELALREPVAALVLHSSFTSIPDIGSELFPFLPVRLIGHIKYNTLAKLPRIHVPVLVVHSRNDDLIPFHHAERNYAAANPPKSLCPISGSHGETLGRSEPPEFSALQNLAALVLTNAPATAK